LSFVCLTLAGQAFTDNVPKPAETNVPKPTDTDQTFLLGLRRIGVMAGQVVECSAEADKPAR
jgi:hypothetical protein